MTPNGQGQTSTPPPTSTSTSADPVPDGAPPPPGGMTAGLQQAGAEAVNEREGMIIDQLLEPAVPSLSGGAAPLKEEEVGEAEEDDWGEEIWDEEMEAAMQAAERALEAGGAVSGSSVSPNAGAHGVPSPGVENRGVAEEALVARWGQGMVDIEDTIRDWSEGLYVLEAEPGAAIEVELDEPTGEAAVVGTEEGGAVLGSGEGGDELEPLIPFNRFRTRGFLSVTDLVGLVWCETQFDYRLRTPSYIPLDQRPEVITSTTGKEIHINKVKVEEGAKVMRRGEKIHKRLERQIHGEGIKVVTKTREDVWGLRLLNMLSGFEALLTIGKCREMPVAGFVNGVLVMGIIDEITRQPLNPVPAKPSTRSKKDTLKDPNQTPLTAFFAPTTPTTPRRRPAPPPPAPTAPTASRERTHKLAISDSKTRTVPSIPKEEDSISGRLQVMLYKEILDSILLACLPSDEPGSIPDPTPEAHPALESYLPTSPTQPFSWARIYTHLDLCPTSPFSEEFVSQSQVVVRDNGLRWGAEEVRDLQGMVKVLGRYVEEMGLGVPAPVPHPEAKAEAGVEEQGQEVKVKEGRQWANLGRTEDTLELVYRRAGGTKKGRVPRRARKERKPRESRKRRRRDDDGDGSGGGVEQVEDGGDGGEEYEGGVGDETMAEATMNEEEQMIQLAIAESLGLQPPTSAIPSFTIPSSSISDAPQGPTDGPRHIREEDDSSDLSSDDELFMAAMEFGLGDEPARAKLELEVPGGTGLAQVNSSPVKPPRTPPRTQAQLAPALQAPATPATPSRRPPAAPAPPTPTAVKQDSATSKDNQPAGSIIGTSRFTHDPERLGRHLVDVMGFWMGERAPRGVEEKDARRCGWCEFEEGCEWRLMKVEEHKKRMRR
ncbi:hypothetical protein IAT38_004638 [Cryptococcus sp. DSM 104549]